MQIKKTDENLPDGFYLARRETKDIIEGSGTFTLVNNLNEAQYYLEVSVSPIPLKDKEVPAISYLLSLAPVAFAAGKEDVSLDTASLDKDVTSVYGTDCEKVKPGEARSTVRVRVTDKASYLAVSSLPDLRNAKVELNEHDFNVMVYNLVDNNIEDMAIRTTKQTPEEICVEVTGYISGKNIFAAIDEALDRQKNGEEDNVTAENGGLAPSDLAETENGPQPEAEAKPEQPAKTDLAKKEPLYTPDESIPPPPVSESQTPSAEQEKEDYLQAKAASKGLIYITPTEFFNKTTSAKYAEILREMFVKSDYFYVTDKIELADYVIGSKVLRAKVDPINKDTNRMQMVIAVESRNTDSGETETEHQNRFVLFSSSENEQKVAAKLMKQLFEKAADKIITELEIAQRRKNNDAGLPAVITPVSTSTAKKGAL